MKRLAISFSGGETSAYMTYLILSKYAERYDEIKIIFMNTSRENEATLIFVDQCDTQLFKPLNFSVVWLEAVVFHKERRRCGAKIVNFKTAARDGSVYEEVIKKYGIPNKSYPHCNRELKLSPFTSFLEDTGWQTGSYDTAIGIRADEIDRMALNRKEKRLIYPLVSWVPTTKPQINTWFSKQSFRLDQKGYQGNCKDCWKKSFRKLYTIACENPRHFDFSINMEAKYSKLRGDERAFFRMNTNAEKVLFDGLSKLGTDFKFAEDDSVIFETVLDEGGSCDGGETCEPFSTDGFDAT